MNIAPKLQHQNLYVFGAFYLKHARKGKSEKR